MAVVDEPPASDRRSQRRNYAYNSANELCWKLVGATGTDCSTNPTGSETFTYEGDGAGHTTGNESAEGGSGANRTASTYNVRDQLSQFTVGATNTNLSYFGDGQDDLYTVGSTTYRDTILGLTQIGSDTYTRDNAGGLVAQNTANGLQYLHTDALGSVRAVTGSTGAVAKRFDYDPYGRAISTDVPGPSTSRFGFAGGDLIDAGSFYHFGARYYDPALLRWTQPDPVLQPTDPNQANLYAYAGDDPTNTVDPGGTYIPSDANGRSDCGTGYASWESCTAWLPNRRDDPARGFACFISGGAVAYATKRLPWGAGYLIGYVADRVCNG